MTQALIDSIYANVKANADRYWARIWLVHKLYHDEDLCNAANAAQHHRTLGYTHVRESLVDSAIVSLTRGFLDQGKDSLSLFRLIPSSSDYLSNNKPNRLQEEEEACSLLYESWYEGHPTDGNFIQIWTRLTEVLNAFRKSDQIGRILDMRNKMVAHSLDRALAEPPEYADLYWVREQIAPIMNDLSGLIEHRSYDWGMCAAEHESTAIGFGKVLGSGFDALNKGS